MNEAELLEKIDFLKKNGELIDQTNSLEELYELLEKTNQTLNHFYPHIGCKDKCFLCCQHSNIPSVTQLEWQATFESLKKLNEKTKAKVISNTKKLFEKYGKELKAIHNALALTDEKNKLNELYTNLTAFQGTSCVLLDKGSCTAYDGRPVKCRTQGASVVKYAETVQFQSCAPEVSKMIEFLDKQGSRKTFLPFSNNYEFRVGELNTSTNKVSTILPIWVYSHIKDNDFVSEVNLNPDFNVIFTGI